MAGASSPVDFNSIFNTVGTTVSSILKSESDADLARARIRADATRDAAAIQAGYRPVASGFGSSFDVSGLLSSVVPLVGVAIVGKLLLAAFKR